jgi:hypothetical protein
MAAALAVLDAVNGKKLPDTADRPSRILQLDPAGSRINVNLPEAHRVEVFDRAAGNEMARRGLADSSANFPIAVDTAGRLPCRVSVTGHPRSLWHSDRQIDQRGDQLRQCGQVLLWQETRTGP